MRMLGGCAIGEHLIWYVGKEEYEINRVAKGKDAGNVAGEVRQSNFLEAYEYIMVVEYYFFEETERCHKQRPKGQRGKKCR